MTCASDATLVQCQMGPHVIADPVVNRTEGFFGDGGLGLNCTVKLSDLLVEQVVLHTVADRSLATTVAPLLKHRVSGSLLSFRPTSHRITRCSSHRNWITPD